ncbi:DUF4041 domain-containing protein [Enorma burkinafasonensis]|uniref:DUF4041 domain-containing protein n=1 Tax=Enorma burkinafasonensis TaxID=2590867 RepID=UPI0026F06046|nr:DUF4041 domain-containing protein [Enorma burkinafasonensis]MCI7730076.1 DUF4041 domain-containing protein [Enorma burkinafasonensis]
MGITDLLKAREYKERAENLSKAVAQMNEMLTPEMRNAVTLKQEIERLEGEKRKRQAELDGISNEVDLRNRLVGKLDASIEAKKSQIATFDDAILVQDFGLYEPRFDFANSTQFRDELKRCRAQQRDAIKEINQQVGNSTWTVNGSVQKGRKMVRETTKLLMRAYNGECDEIVRKVKATNVSKSIEQVYKTADAINRLGSTLGISVPPPYQQLKEREVRLAYEFALQKEREKEALREAREQEREARKLAQEIAAARKKLEKERKQYLSAYKEIAERLKGASDEERADLEARADELKARLDDVDAAVADVDYREANQKAGFVYVISNIGSFGEGVYKIGMTRRLDPMERVRELGDASVPFNFDVHAMIFCDDAPKLEAALHHEFEDRKVNIVNQRREFFKVSLSEIEEVVKRNYDKTVEFSEVPDAEQFRTSEELRKRGIYHFERG